MPMKTAWRIMESLIDGGWVVLSGGGGHDVTMLTNFAADTFAEARTRFPRFPQPAARGSPFPAR